MRFRNGRPEFFVSTRIIDTDGSGIKMGVKVLANSQEQAESRALTILRAQQGFMAALNPETFIAVDYNPPEDTSNFFKKWEVIAVNEDWVRNKMS